MTLIGLTVFFVIAMLISGSFGWGYGIWCQRNDPDTQKIDDEHFSKFKTISYAIFVLVVMLAFIYLLKFVLPH